MIVTEANVMIWFISGYALVALAFYSFIMKTAQDEPNYDEIRDTSTAPLRQYITQNSHDVDPSERKAA